LLVVDSLDFRPSSQCIFVRVRPSCFLLVKMCLCRGGGLDILKLR
jgi:hypothetical protein